MNSTVTVKEQINVWVDKINVMMRQKRCKERVEVGTGRKYIKVWANELHNPFAGGPQSRVYAFIRASDGAIFKPANRKAPAKHARGSIYDDDVTVACTTYGPKYMPGTGAGSAELAVAPNID